MSYTLKDLAVFFDTSEAGQRLLSVAAKIAKQQDAHLIGLTSAHYDNAVRGDSFARGSAIPDVIRRHLDAAAAHLLKALHCLNATADRHEICGEFRVVEHTETQSETVLHSLSCDLLIASHPPAQGAPFAWSSVELLQRIGVPVLIVPSKWKRDAVGRNIIVAWNSTRQARRAIADSMPLLIGADSVDLLIVDPDRSPGLHGEEPGADMAAHLARHGVNVTLVRAESDGNSVASAILTHAVNRNCDLLVLGAGHHSKLVDAVLGGVARKFLTDVPLPLFISH